jgi:ribosome maturation protein SDO1
MEKPLVVRYQVNKHTFEALVHAGKVKAYRDGTLKNVRDVLMDDENVYKDHHKGTRWAKSELEAAFGSSNVDEILKTIVEKGKAQVAHDELKEETEKKAREMINYIHKQYVDSKGLPIPVTRIESAFDTIKGFVVDPKRSAATQVSEIERKLIDCGLSMKRNEMEGTITIPHAHLSSAKAVVQRFCSVRDTKMTSDGAVYNVGLAPGAFDEMMAALGSITKGEFSFDMPTPSLAATPKASAAAAKAPAGGGGGGGGGKGKKKA